MRRRRDPDETDRLIEEMNDHIRNGGSDAERSRPAPHRKKEDAEPPAGKTAEAEAAKTVEGLLRDIMGDTDNNGKTLPEAKGTVPKKPHVSAQARDGEIPEIVTNEDGQSAFSFAEVDRFAPPEVEEAEDKEEENSIEDEEQLNLFSSFDVNKPHRHRAFRTDSFLRGVDAEEDDAGREQSDDDIRFLLALDYEDELGNAIGFDRIRAYRELDINGENQKLKRRKKGEKREFEAAGQDISMRKQYAAQQRGFLWQFIFSAFILMLTVFYERPHLLQKIFRFLSDGTVYRLPYILIGLQVLILASIFSYKRLFDGLVQLVRFAPIDSSYCSVMMLGTILYHILLLFLPQEGYPTLFLSPVAGSLMILKLADLLDWRRESSAFQVVSSRKEKFALLPRVSVGGPQNNARVRLDEVEDGEKTLYVCPVNFVRHYFANTDKRAEHQTSMGILLFLTSAVGAVLALAVFALGKGLAASVQTAFVTFLLSIPLTSLLVTSLPMYFASVMRLKKKSAIVGEEAVYASGGKTALVLPDKGIFNEMSHDRFEFVKGGDREYTERLLHALLVKIGSPLAETVRGGEEEIEIVLTEIAERGVSALAGAEKTPILFGDVDYLHRYGIEVQSRRENLEEMRRRLLCVAIDGRVQALSLANYHMTDDMLRLLDELEADDVRAVIRTKDPAVYDEMLKQMLPEREEIVRVMKPSAKETDISTARADVTVVSLDSPQEAARTFTICRRVRRVGNFGKWLGMISTAFGMALSALLAFRGAIGKINGIAVTLYLLSWGVLHALVSYLRLRAKKEV